MRKKKLRALKIARALITLFIGIIVIFLVFMLVITVHGRNYKMYKAWLLHSTIYDDENDEEIDIALFDKSIGEDIGRFSSVCCLTNENKYYFANIVAYPGERLEFINDKTFEYRILDSEGKFRAGAGEHTFTKTPEKYDGYVVEDGKYLVEKWYKNEKLEGYYYYYFEVIDQDEVKGIETKFWDYSLLDKLYVNIFSRFLQ